MTCIALRYPGPVIRNCHVDAPRTALHRHADTSLAPRENLNCIQDQVRNYLKHLTSRDPDGRGAAKPTLYLDPAPGELVAMQLQCGFGDFYEIKLFRIRVLAMEGKSLLGNPPQYL